MRGNPEIDTIVCPAQKEGFNDVFLRENRWFKIRINPERIPKIKYIAMYESKPIAAITYVGKVKEIKPYKNKGVAKTGCHKSQFEQSNKYHVP